MYEKENFCSPRMTKLSSRVAESRATHLPSCSKEWTFMLIFMLTSFYRAGEEVHLLRPVVPAVWGHPQRGLSGHPCFLGHGRRLEIWAATVPS